LDPDNDAEENENLTLLGLIDGNVVDGIAEG